MDAKDVLAAIQSSDLETLEGIINAQPDLANARDENGVSLLLQAAYHRHWEMVEVFLAHKKILDIFEAAALNRSERIKQLSKTEPDLTRAWSSDGFTALHLASFFGHLESVEILVANGADVTTTSRNPMTVAPIGSASSSGQTKIVEFLLAHGAEVDAPQTGGVTALHSAAHNGNQPLVRLLLLNGADPSLRMDDGRNAVDMARDNGHDTVVQLLEAALQK